MIPDDIYSKLYPSSGNLSPIYRPDVPKQNASVNSNMVSNNPAPFPKSTPIAMGYVPFQQWGNTFSAEEAFNTGTLFPELDKPFLGRKV